MANFGVTGSKSWFSKFKKTTTTRLTSGSGTYNVPAGVKRLKITMVGGGGSGAPGDSVGGATYGLDATDTTFGTSLLTAGGGSGGSYVASGIGGQCVINSPAITILDVTGTRGKPGHRDGTYTMAGNGGDSFFGGSGSASLAGGGYGANPNTGSGGGGGAGASGSTLGTSAGSGGSGGGYIEAIINNPDTSYSYAIGSGGASVAGVNSGLPSGAGADGIIIIEEIY